MPVKSQAVGNFNCTGSLVLYNEINGNVTQSYPFTANIASYWDNAKGGLVTTFEGAPNPTDEYAVKQGVSCLIGVFSNAGVPLYGESLDTPFNWRTISYVRPDTRHVDKIQIYKPLENGNEMVTFSSFNDAGVMIDQLYLICKKI